jgi:hypothetical protein
MFDSKGVLTALDGKLLDEQLIRKEERTEESLCTYMLC